jgi:hypothetical protein
MPLLFVLVSPHAFDHVGPVEGLILLAALTAGAAYMAWTGYGLFQASRAVKNPRASVNAVSGFAIMAICSALSVLFAVLLVLALIGRISPTAPPR